MFIGACSVTSKGRKGRQGRHFLHEGIPFLPCIIADATFLTIADAICGTVASAILQIQGVRYASGRIWSIAPWRYHMRTK